VRSARSYHQEADHLRRQGRTDSEIVEQWKERYHVNSRVAYRLAHGWTQEHVAHLWNERWPDAGSPKTGKHISYWETWPAPAGRPPSPETLNRLACLYRCQAGELLDGEDHRPLDQEHHSPAPSPRADSAHLEELTTSLGLGLLKGTDPIPRLTDQTVSSLQALTDTYRRLDYQEGAHRVRADVTRHLRRMIELTDRPASPLTRRNLLKASADAAQLSAWLAIDTRRYRHAARYCEVAISMAEKADDHALRSYSLGVMSYIHLHAGDGRAALDILQAARSSPARALPPAVNAWLTEATGEAYGLLRDTRKGLLALAETERIFDRVTSAETPPWLAFFDADCHAARLKGRCLIRLGQPQQSVPALHEALHLLPETFVRERSGTLIDLATAYLQLHDIEQACEAATYADQLARATNSERNRKRLRELLLGFLPWTSQDSVKSLYHQILSD